MEQATQWEMQHDSRVPASHTNTGPGSYQGGGSSCKIQSLLLSATAVIECHRLQFTKMKGCTPEVHSASLNSEMLDPEKQVIWFSDEPRAPCTQ